jgi:hypothetical protein
MNTTCKIIKLTKGASALWVIVRCSDAQGFVCNKMLQADIAVFKGQVGDTLSVPTMYLRDLPVSAPVAAPAPLTTV